MSYNCLAYPIIMTEEDDLVNSINILTVSLRKCYTCQNYLPVVEQFMNNYYCKTCVANLINFYFYQISTSILNIPQYNTRENDIEYIISQINCWLHNVSDFNIYIEIQSYIHSFESLRLHNVRNFNITEN